MAVNVLDFVETHHLLSFQESDFRESTEAANEDEGPRLSALNADMGFPGFPLIRDPLFTVTSSCESCEYSMSKSPARKFGRCEAAQAQYFSTFSARKQACTSPSVQNPIASRTSP